MFARKPLCCVNSCCLLLAAFICWGCLGELLADRGPLRAETAPPQSAVAEHAQQDQPGTSLPGTQPLDWSGDIASRMIDGIDAFLLRQTPQTLAARTAQWEEALAQPEWPNDWLEAKRQRLADILGVKDARAKPVKMSVQHRPGQDLVLAEAENYLVLSVTWDVFADFSAEGLLLWPKAGSPRAFVVAIPDADITPEGLVGLEEGVPTESQYARRLAENGCAVLVPAIVSREMSKQGRVTLTHREFLYRPAYELGRHLIGYELQEILAAVDYVCENHPQLKSQIGVLGWGEGGMLAFFAAALDQRIQVAGVSGYLGSCDTMWQQPVDRNVFSYLRDFGDAETAMLISPRPLVVEACRSPHVTIPSGLGGAPGELTAIRVNNVRAAVDRIQALAQQGKRETHAKLVISGDGQGPFGSDSFLGTFLGAFGHPLELAGQGQPPRALRNNPWREDRLQRIIAALDRHTQRFLHQSAKIRQQFWQKLDVTSLQRLQQTVEWYRQYFSDDVIGNFQLPLSDPQPRTRKWAETPQWVGYEVVLDVFDGVFAYGILLVPRGIGAEERRPVVVCQHGLEGRPEQTIRGDNSAYHDFAARLAERGFVVFAPQNPYIFGDRFRTLQRKANPLGKTLFSVIVPQHQQIVNWLKTLPFVDPQRIAFYGLSYGGKTAMRVPPLVRDYCAVICSGDFNEWVWKNASTDSPYSYVWTGEYEIFEFGLGETFNYAEMAALIAPRPFMVERGHFDGVAPDETVAYEYAKVRFLYEARLGIGDRTEIEWFVGPHTIHGVGTFNFLHRHLKYP